MLALADRDGVVSSTIPGLSDRARISLKECERALEVFQQPDKYSSTKDFDGRRIEAIDGGWRLLNHAKYRKLMSKDDQREKTRVRVATWRAKQKAVTPTVTLSNVSNEKYDIAEADTDTKAREGASPRYMQSDFDERDMRKFLQARTAIAAKLSTGWGQNLTDEELFVEQCMIAEVPPKTMREVLARNGETA